MSPGAKEYVFTGAVTAAPHEAAKLRTVLREALELSGFHVTAGITTVETWMVAAMATRPAPFRERTQQVWEAEHTGKLKPRGDKRGAL